MKRVLVPVLAGCALPIVLWPLALLAGGPEGFLHNGVTAHRGNSTEHPENTLPAFRTAIELGADWMELDIYRTRDGRLVVIHDETTARVGDQDLNVPASTYSQLQAVDVATGFRKKHGVSLEKCPAQRIPLLEDVLRLAMTQEKTRVSIQPKMDCVDDAVAVVRRLGADRWVGFNDGKLAYMSRVKKLAPTIPVFWDLDRQNLDEDIRTAKQHGFEALVLRDDLVTEKAVDQVRSAGLEAGVWTVNDETTMRRLLAWGVTRMYTDCPAKLLAIVRQSRPAGSVQCEGHYPMHLQGICTDNSGALFWSFTNVLAKTDAGGHLLKKIDVASHHGDLCFHGDKLYVAVNLGEFNNPQGNADSWVYVYQAADLAELARHKAPEVTFGAGGIGCDGRRLLVVGGLPPDAKENYAYEYDLDLHFVKKHVLASGYTLMGIQTAAYAQGNWWFGCYGWPTILLKTDDGLQMQGCYPFNASLGIVGLGDGRFLVAADQNEKGKGHVGSVRLARPDTTKGLTLVQ